MSDWQLTEIEVRRITGAVHRRKQLAYFASLGVPAELGGDNQVKVLREAYERRMLPDQSRSARRPTGPNLAAMRRKAG